MWLAIGLCLLGVSLAKWNEPIELYSEPYVAAGDFETFQLKDMYVDPSTGISHIMWLPSKPHGIQYWQIDGERNVISKYEFVDEQLFGYFGGRIVGAGNGKDFYALVTGLRDPAQDDVFFAESHDGGKTWTDLARVPRDNPDDSRDREGDALLYIPETGRLFIFYHLRGAPCEPIPEPDRLCYVTRPAGSATFTNEKIIVKHRKYSQVYPSATAAYTMVDAKPVVHLLWGNSDETSHPIYYVRSEDNGITWSVPKIISGDDHFAGEYMLDMVSNPKLTSMLLGTYTVKPEEKQRLFFSKDGGNSFEITDGTNLRQMLYAKYYHLSSMQICGSSNTPIMFKLSQTHEDLTEYSVWDINKMTVQRPESPFDSVMKAAGVKLTCYNKDDKIVVTALVSVGKEDGLLHMMIAQDFFDAPASE